jgi:amino acid adenylation domain-containing protein
MPSSVSGFYPDKLENALFIQDLFAQQKELTPHAVAIRFRDMEISYRELDERSDTLAVQILRRSPGSSIAGVSTTRSIEMVVAVLAVLKSGKAYLPIDPAYPSDRLQQIVSDSAIDTCLCLNTESSFFESLGVSVIATDQQHEKLTVNFPKGPLAYVLYTSGSTGKPKGVCMGQTALVNLLLWQEKHSIAGQATKTLQFAPLSFDVSFQELFATLTTGGTLVLIEDDLRLDPQNLLRFIDRESINRIFVPFVALQYLAEAADSSQFYPSSLREVMTAGEQLKVTPQVVRFFTHLPHTTLFNQYGPTECHVVTELKLEGPADQWPALPSIGTAIDNTEILILDEQLKPLPQGETGELCIAGTCVAEGYLNKPELTAEKFGSIVVSSGKTESMYRTGDLARIHANGEIEFLGRKDDQVKIRGYRIELGEIEVLINKLSNISQAIVVAREDVPGQKRLVAYLVSADGSNDTQAVRRAIEQQLPEYMMPSAFVWVTELPKTTSGKVDKKALPKPEIKRPELSVLYKAPVTTTEQNIASLWSALLQVDKVGVHDNFFELGGNSLLAVKTVSGLKSEYGLNVPISKIYQHPTIHGIATYLGGNTKSLRTTAISRENADADIAVIGMAGRFPGANTIDEFWKLLKEGRETTRFFSAEELETSIAAEIKNDPNYVRARGVIDGAKEFEPAFFGLSPKMAELMDPQQRIFLEVAWEALEKTGYLPQKHESTIGVFAGCGNNTYYYNNVLYNKDLIAKVGSFPVVTVNDKDYVSSRTAYALNLKGPAITVQSACSTSLLAIAQAAESIRKGQCDIALAGGVAITVPINSGHIYEEGAMFSKDGHTRPFDAEARGTVFSDGAGVVVLKSRKQAEQDGDIIFAIIKGTGISNDGGGKGSFTAPSSEGQATAISMAIANAGIEPTSISYVETHGTATPLGDPIEMEGLNLAFGNTEEKQYCAIGSLKSNMGHLTIAAGVASLIKTALSLYHKQIPPSINYTKPNPNIDFTNSPFYVNTVLRDWESESIRRAGISSFGVGGTNVHIILEESGYVDPVSSTTHKPQLICWSARNEASTKLYAEKLQRYVAENNEVELADIAYTLHTTRHGFNERRFLIANDKQDLANQLSTKLPATQAITLKSQPEGITFLFPGQGSQYVNMGKELYDQEPVFKASIDECAGILQEYMGEDIRTVIYPAFADADAETKLKNTYYTQPAIFITELAVARLWMSWGIQPQSFIGHSIGEFVAAHLAGIFSLRDALKIIAARGRFISQLQRGSMLSVRLTIDELKSTLKDNALSIAAINGPNSCVVAGPDENISRYSAELTNLNISNRTLQTSHAFHSSMMDSIVSPFEEIVRSFSLQIPRIPVMSSVTGAWLKDEEATSSVYWANHLRSTVNFSGALTALKTEKDDILLEVGPGNVTSNLAKQHGTKLGSKVITSLDRSTEEPVSEYTSMLRALGQLWLQGIEADWKAFYGKDGIRRKVDIPSYAFNRMQLWVEPKAVVVHDITTTENNHSQPDTIPHSPKLKPMRKNVLIEKAKTILEDASGIDMQDMHPETSFIEMGLDSLILTQIAISLKKNFSLPITFRQLNQDLDNLDRLATFLDENLPQGLYEEAPPAAQTVQVAQPQQPSRPATIANTPASSNDAAFNAIAEQVRMLTEQLQMLKGGSPAPASVGTPAPAVKSPALQLSTDITAEEAVELKKPFGASAKIEKTTTELSPVQAKFLANLTQRYNAKTKGSKAYTQQHRAYMADPRVVSGFKPLTKEITYSLVVNKSKGSRLWDIDGNEYIDALNGFGSSMLGHQPDFIANALKKQIDLGYEVGPQHNLSGDVCRLLCEFTGSDRAALCNTGSEAVLGAMRIARTATGRSLIVAFTGSYHGIVDEVIVRGTKKLKTFPAAPGIMIESVQNMLILDYGTPESLAIIKQRAHELAAVLVEPVQSRRPDFLPVEFLKELRAVTEQSGTALIFDEVITGFRMHPAGMQGILGIRADIATYGKVIGGGISIGAIAGKKQFMDALDGGFWQFGDASTPEAGVTYFAGTFVRHPLALAAAKASLDYMKEKGIGLQQGLNQKTKSLVDKINAVCQHYKLPIVVVSYGSLWRTKFTKDVHYSELLFTLMREKGIHIQDGFPCFITDAFTNYEIETIANKFEESAVEMIEADFFPESKGIPRMKDAAAAPLSSAAPIPGARLGRDKDGNPAWFIMDPDRPGKYLQVTKNN